MACAWVDVRKAYDSVDHKVLRVVLQMHKFPVTLVKEMMKVVKKTSTRLVADTETGKETSYPNPFEESVTPGRQPFSKTIYHLLEPPPPPCMENKNNDRVHIKQANPT